RSLPRLGAPSTHVWVKLEGADRASQALSIIPFTIFDKGPKYPTNTRKSHISESSIHPRLGEVRGGRQCIAGSKHNTLYHFWQRSRISHKHQSTKGHVLA
ncbi:hypothetical protein B296_00024041, partial [Ensete ventricosum]